MIEELQRSQSAIVEEKAALEKKYAPYLASIRKSQGS
jgi:hypothetical protein